MLDTSPIMLQVAELHRALGMPRAPLAMPAPALEGALPPLRAAVLPPALPELPPPPLELFDLDAEGGERLVRSVAHAYHHGTKQS